MNIYLTEYFFTPFSKYLIKPPTRSKIAENGTWKRSMIVLVSRLLATYLKGREYTNVALLW